MKNISDYIVSVPVTIRDAVRQMDLRAVESLIVTENDKVIGLFTMGDFRRAVLSGLDINNDISNIVNRNYIYVDDKYEVQKLKDIFMKNTLIVDVPVLNNRKELVDIVSRQEILSEADIIKTGNGLEKTPVVVMAGGKGKRMDPFTRILPKPLIPLGDKPIIQVIMDEFRKYGMDMFYISLNDKGQMIKAYFHDHDLPYQIQYIEEDKPLGTVGALNFMIDNFNGPLFISNCDIIIYTDYSAIMDFHISGGYDLTIVASMRHYTIPYGICEVDNGGDLVEIKEKPEYNFLVNTGLYIIEPGVLELIPENTYFNMTDLIEKMQDRKMKTGVFPVSEKSWIDIGQWTEYKKTMDESIIKNQK